VPETSPTVGLAATSGVPVQDVPTVVGAPVPAPVADRVVTDGGGAVVPAAAGKPVRLRLDSLTAIRGWFAIPIYLYHACIAFALVDPRTDAPLLAPLRWLVMGSGVSLSLFFVISGFVLTLSRRSTETTGRFYRHRAARIMPDHVLLWIIFALELAWVGRTPTGREFFQGLFLLQSWTPHVKEVIANNSVAWTLSCEAAFYLVFPFVFRVLDRMSSSSRRVLLGLIVVVDLIVPSLIQLLNVTGPDRLYWVAYAPEVRGLEFLFGAVIAMELRKGVRLPSIPLLPAFLLICAAWAGNQIVPSAFAWSIVELIPCGLFVLAVAQHDARGGRVLGGKRFGTPFGEWSMAFYLLHVPAIYFVNEFVLGHQPRSHKVGYALLIVMLPLCIAASGLLHKLYERPLEKRLRGRAPARVD
jgi:peptidoglycan/LPS O-acetylase OafA/YrhL